MGNCVIKVKLISFEVGQDNWREFVLFNFFLNEFLEYCNFVLFGDIKEMKIVFDFEVCLVYEIELVRFKVYRFFGMVYIRVYIEDKFVFGRCVKLDFYKVNVYGEGGFFKLYVDNLFDYNMIGILVICFFFLYKGGELFVNYDGL